MERLGEFMEVYARRLPDWVPPLLEGARITVQLTVLAYLLATAVGLLLAVAQLAPARLVRTIATGYVEIMRGLPVLIVLFLVYFGLPDVGLQLSPFVAAVVGLGLYVGAYLAEVFRGGILSIHQSQREAALAVGLTPRRVSRYVILPQALRAVVPPLTNTAISLTQQTSLAAIIAVRELTLSARNIATLEFRSMHLYLLAAVLYIAMGYAVAWGGKLIERRMHYA